MEVIRSDCICFCEEIQESHLFEYICKCSLLTKNIKYYRTVSVSVIIRSE